MCPPGFEVPTPAGWEGAMGVAVAIATSDIVCILWCEGRDTIAPPMDTRIS